MWTGGGGGEEKKQQKREEVAPETQKHRKSTSNFSTQKRPVPYAISYSHHQPVTSKKKKKKRGRGGLVFPLHKHTGGELK